MRFLILSALVGIVCGALTKPCCVNNRFTGRMTQIGTSKTMSAKKAEFTNNVYWMDYDYNMKKLVMTGVSTDEQGNKHNLTVFQDYANKKTYTQYDSYCGVTQSTETMTPPCVPQNFVSDGTMVFGSGSNMMTVNSFTGMAGGLYMRFTVTDECVPVTMTEFGLEPDNVTGINYSFAFSNIKQGMLSKANPFVAPSPCAAASG